MKGRPVARSTRAWIETFAGSGVVATAAWSHALRVRGLKPFADMLLFTAIASHALRVRGLKLNWAASR